MLPRWNVPLQSDNHMKSCSLLLWPILPGIVYIAVALIRKVSGTALDGGDIDVRMKNWLDWLDKLFLITLIISTSHSCLRLRSCNPCFHWPYSILGNSFLFMCFASISISTGHPFLTIISRVFTLHFSWYILFSAAGGHELQHVGVLAAELQLRCSVFDDLNTIWVNVREEILQVLLVPHAVKHHGIVHDSKFPFHIYIRCSRTLQGACEGSKPQSAKQPASSSSNLVMRPVWGWSMKLFRYGWLPHDIALLFLFQTRAAHSHAGWTWIWTCFCSNLRPDCAPCIAGGSDSRRCNALLEIQHLHLHPLYLVWSLWVGHSFLYFFPLTILPVDFEIPSVFWPPLPRLGLNQRVGDNHCNMFIVFWRKGWLSISMVLSSCCAPRPTNSPNVVIAHSLPITCSLD